MVLGKAGAEVGVGMVVLWNEDGGWLLTTRLMKGGGGAETCGGEARSVGPKQVGNGQLSTSRFPVRGHHSQSGKASNAVILQVNIRSGVQEAALCL